MAKFNVKNLIIATFFGVLLFGVIGIANAQQTLPEGGDSFETAAELELGEYQGGALEEYQEFFYYLQGKAGQEIRIKAKFLPEGNFTVALYDEDEEELTGYDYGSDHEYSWLANADKSSYKYYLEIANHEWPVDSFSLEISLADYYDADSQTDAGDSFGKAIDVTLGEYEGYLSGEKGTDAQDFYKMAVEKGDDLTVKLTPESEVILGLKTYDSDRVVINEEYASNAGAIVKISSVAEKSEDIFVLVYSDRWGEELIDYTLDISAEAEVPVEEEIGEEELPEVIGLAEGEEETGLDETGKELAKKGIKDLLIPIVIGLVVLVVIIVVIVILVRKKKE